MNHYVMHDIETDGGEPNDPKVMAKCYSRVEAEMLLALFKKHLRPGGMPASDSSIFILGERQLDFEDQHRRAVAAYEVDGPDPKDAAEIDILRASLGRLEDEGDLRRYMIQRVLVEDAGTDSWWREKMLDWILEGGHREGMEAFERRLVEERTEHDKWMEQMQAEHEARRS